MYKLLNNNLDIDLEAVHRKNIELEWQASLNNNKIFERENESFSFYNPNEGYFYFELVKVEGSETQLQVNLVGLPFVNQITADVVKTEIDHITKITTDENDTKSGVNGVVIEVVRIITNIEDYVIYNQVIVFEFYPPEVEIILEP